MNFADETRESSSSDGWKFKEDEEDEENAKHIGESKSNDRPTRKRRRIPPWEWKKRRRRDKGVVAISREKRRLFVRCVVIRCGKFCICTREIVK
jgi:hypothetical protein|tara:strand:+ start:634 stop:915 length:282 start_codon:yes stop_codon:yes gene_type:complete